MSFYFKEKNIKLEVASYDDIKFMPKVKYEKIDIKVELDYEDNDIAEASPLDYDNGEIKKESDFKIFKEEIDFGEINIKREIDVKDIDIKAKVAIENSEFKGKIALADHDIKEEISLEDFDLKEEVNHVEIIINNEKPSFIKNEIEKDTDSSQLVLHDPDRLSAKPLRHVCENISFQNSQPLPHIDLEARQPQVSIPSVMNPPPVLNCENVPLSYQLRRRMRNNQIKRENRRRARRRAALLRNNSSDQIEELLEKQQIAIQVQEPFELTIPTESHLNGSNEAHFSGCEQIIGPPPPPFICYRSNSVDNKSEPDENPYPLHHHPVGPSAISLSVVDENISLQNSQSLPHIDLENRQLQSASVQVSNDMDTDSLPRGPDENHFPIPDSVIPTDESLREGDENIPLQPSHSLPLKELENKQPVLQTPNDLNCPPTLLNCENVPLSYKMRRKLRKRQKQRETRRLARCRAKALLLNNPSDQNEALLPEHQNASPVQELIEPTIPKESVLSEGNEEHHFPICDQMNGTPPPSFIFCRSNSVERLLHLPLSGVDNSLPVKEEVNFWRSNSKASNNPLRMPDENPFPLHYPVGPSSLPLNVVDENISMQNFESLPCTDFENRQPLTAPVLQVSNDGNSALVLNCKNVPLSYQLTRRMRKNKNKRENRRRARRRAALLRNNPSDEKEELLHEGKKAAQVPKSFEPLAEVSLLGVGDEARSSSCEQMDRSPPQLSFIYCRSKSVEQLFSLTVSGDQDSLPVKDDDLRKSNSKDNNSPLRMPQENPFPSYYSVRPSDEPLREVNEKSQLDHLENRQPGNSTVFQGSIDMDTDTLLRMTDENHSQIPDAVIPTDESLREGNGNVPLQPSKPFSLMDLENGEPVLQTSNDLNRVRFLNGENSRLIGKRKRNILSRQRKRAKRRLGRRAMALLRNNLSKQEQPLSLPARIDPNPHPVKEEVNSWRSNCGDADSPPRVPYGNWSQVRPSALPLIEVDKNISFQDS